jgi:hypothetical protein
MEWRKFRNDTPDQSRRLQTALILYPPLFEERASGRKQLCKALRIPEPEYTMLEEDYRLAMKMPVTYARKEESNGEEIAAVPRQSESGSSVPPT